MEDKELAKIINDFVKKCKTKNCIGIATVASENGQNSKIGLATDYMQAVSLVRNIFIQLQDLTGIPSTLTVTHLALSLAILEVHEAKGSQLEKIDNKSLEEAAKVIKKLIDFELKKARQVNLSSTFSNGQ